MSKRYYLAYGSNMVQAQMDKRCPDATLVSKEYADGWELTFKQMPGGTYLDMVQKPGTQTPVFVWEISEQDEKNLDGYEDWPRSYIKQDILWSGGTAMMYVVADEHTQFGIPEPVYIDPILDLYEAEGYDTTHLHNLLKGGQNA